MNLYEFQNKNGEILKTEKSNQIYSEGMVIKLNSKQYTISKITTLPEKNIITLSLYMNLCD